MIWLRTISRKSISLSKCLNSLHAAFQTPTMPEWWIVGRGPWVVILKCPFAKIQRRKKESIKWLAKKEKIKLSKISPAKVIFDNWNRQFSKLHWQLKRSWFCCLKHCVMKELVGYMIPFWKWMMRVWSKLQAKKSGLTSKGLYRQYNLLK